MLRFCNYCHKPVPQGYDLWWREKPYHPDCAVQVAVTDTDRNTRINRNTEINEETEPNTERRENEMNCKYCEKHIVATCQVMWRGYPFHEDCLAKAIQEANQPPKEQFTGSSDDYDDYNEYDDFFPEDEEDFAEDELSQVEPQPEYAGGHTLTEPEVLPPTRDVHINEVAASATKGFVAERSNGNIAQAGTLIAHCGARRITRNELVNLPTPPATATFKPVGHASLVDRIMDSLWYRRMTVVRDEYAVSADGMKMFGLIELDIEYKGVRFAIGLRNANDRSMRLAMVAGYKVTVCDNMMLQGDFQPLLAKHSKNLELEDSLAVACDRVQRNFGRLHGEITEKQERHIESGDAKRLLYNAFTEGKFPISLMRTVHKEFFIEPSYEEFRQSTMWSLENAFTTAFKKLEPVSQFQYTARLGKFFAAYN